MKYPRTYHLPFSPGGTNDDKRLKSIDQFINTEVVITEKLDGGNTCLYDGKTYARSHAGETSHPSFDYIKSNYSWRTKNMKYHVYGENMYAVHSIEYANLTEYFYVFAMADPEWSPTFLSWDEMVYQCDDYRFTPVPLLYRGYFFSEAELVDWFDRNANLQSFFGGECEGFVIRDADPCWIDNPDYPPMFAKYVRKDHVQTDQHWSKNWRKAELND